MTTARSAGTTATPPAISLEEGLAIGPGVKLYTRYCMAPGPDSGPELLFAM